MWIHINEPLIVSQSGKGPQDLVTGNAGRCGDPRSRERRPNSRNGDEPGRLQGRRRNSSLPLVRAARGTRRCRHRNSTIPHQELKDNRCRRGELASSHPLLPPAVSEASLWHQMGRRRLARQGTRLNTYQYVMGL